MILKNNWFRTNIEDLHKDVYAKIRYTYDRGDFIPSNFADAAQKIALELQAKYEHIYVAFSGGMDSEYVVRLFHKNNIKFTPVCAWPEATRSVPNAHSVCKELNIKPITIELSDDDILEILEEMNIKINCLINNPPIYAVCKLAKKMHNDAIVVTGECFFPENFDADLIPKEGWVYCDLLKYKDIILPFFIYNQHIVYEIIVARQSKEQLYEIAWRKKIMTRDYVSKNLKEKAEKYFKIDRRNKSWTFDNILENRILLSKLLSKTQ